MWWDFLFALNLSVLSQMAEYATSTPYFAGEATEATGSSSSTLTFDCVCGEAECAC